MDWKGTLELRNPARCASHAFHECKPKRESAAQCAGGRILQFNSFSTSRDLNINVCTRKPMASIHPQEHFSQEVRVLRARSSSLALLKYFLSEFVVCYIMK